MTRYIADLVAVLIETVLGQAATAVRVSPPGDDVRAMLGQNGRSWTPIEPKGRRAGRRAALRAPARAGQVRGSAPVGALQGAIH